MFEKITNKFVPDQKESSKTYRNQIGIFQGWVSTAVNTLLFIFKLFVGIITGAVSLIADAVHTLSDVVTSLIVIWGFKQSKKPADIGHPYGHGRAEYIATLIISVLLCVAGIEFIETAIDRIKNPILIISDWWMIAILGLTVVIKEITARYAKFLSSKIASGLLHADAWHHRTDAVSSILVLIALIAGNFGYSSIDGWAGLFVALILIYTGFDIARDSVDDLIGKPPDVAELDTIRDIALSVPGALGVHDISVHSYGLDKFVSIHAEINAKKTAAEAHDISEEIESKLGKAMGVEPTVHLDPVNPDDPMVKEVKYFLDEKNIDDDRISGVHDIRIVNTENHHVILFGMNVRLGLSQKQIIACKEELNRLLKEKFNGYEINIKVSSSHQF
ncbi:MAG: cation diffusion facilitator family transporter [Candidatus Neomarinimicrobiota bacterium]|nr:cation diffusion facilitator family transporter [Candidatus Neomarinimicrobiota bacterium]